jgi:hypothetical protein
MVLKLSIVISSDRNENPSFIHFNGSKVFPVSGSADPKCKIIRWNQRYLDEELALIDRLQDELYETGLIRETGEKIVYKGNHALYLLTIMNLFLMIF